MGTGSTLQQARALESALAGLRGIRKARVNMDRDGVAIEVLAVPERSEDTLRRKVIDVARSTLGSDRPVTASILFAARRSLRGAEEPRRRLSSLITRRTHDRFATQVILSRGGDVSTGESECHPRHQPERAVAQAVIDGLYDVSDRPINLQDVETLSLGATPVVLVSLDFGDRHLVGSAEIHFDVADAIVRATLHALNRSISYAR